MFKKNITGHAKLFLHHVVPAAVRPVHSLWHEIIGFLFIVLGVFIGGYGVRTWSHYSGDASEFLRIALSSCFALVMAAFGISSFRKARKISRS
jgi:hypothetical protein